MAASATVQFESPETPFPLTGRQLAHEEIASLAYDLWLERGCPTGSPEEDWSRAEQELLARLNA
jgi:hypothetical protein